MKEDVTLELSTGARKPVNRVHIIYTMVISEILLLTQLTLGSTGPEHGDHRGNN